MPLKEGKGEKVVSANIKELYAANKSKPQDAKRPTKQIIAIALAKSREKKKY